MQVKKNLMPSYAKFLYYMRGFFNFYTSIINGNYSQVKNYLSLSVRKERKRALGGGTRNVELHSKFSQKRKNRRGVAGNLRKSF